MLLPAGTIEELDKCRRAFLSSGDATVSGAQCLVSWEKVCIPQKNKAALVLRISEFRTSASCSNYDIRLHHPWDSSWVRWVWGQVNIALLDGALDGAHWSDLHALVPVYRAVSTTAARDGESTAFWLDNWLPVGQLAEVFPALFSYSTDAATSVPRLS